MKKFFDISKSTADVTAPGHTYFQYVLVLGSSLYISRKMMIIRLSDSDCSISSPIVWTRKGGMGRSDSMMCSDVLAMVALATDMLKSIPTLSAIRSCLGLPM